MVPKAALIQVLINPNNPNTASTIAELQETASAVGQRLEILAASDESEVGTAIARFSQRNGDALLVDNDPFYLNRREAIVAAAARHKLPAIYPFPEFAEAGGLMAYGASSVEGYRLVGMYAARILKGTAPADLPVQQATRLAFVLNLKTAKAQGIEIPPLLLTRADEVIE